MNQFFEFLSRYNRREQTILLVGALVVFVYLLWRAVLVPLQDWRSEQIQRNANVQQALGRVEVLSARLQEYRRSGTGNGQSSGNLSRVIDTSLSAAGLAMSGFQPGTGGEAREIGRASCRESGKEAEDDGTSATQRIMRQRLRTYERI